MAVSIKELQTTPIINSEATEKICSELKLIRQSIAAAVFAFGTEEQIRRYNEHIATTKPA
ncbi:MAG: hypothetical protein H7122_15425 [Chitinophagaceae bacterium]|nr:hypothetical protein [Chitinophagaceae bacterium]